MTDIFDRPCLFAHPGSGLLHFSRTAFNGTSDPAGNIARAIDHFLNIPPGGKPVPGGWQDLSGHNCWGDRGTGRSHGATDLENPASSAAPGSPMTLAECEAACSAMPGCSGITVQADGSGKVDCFRKADIVADSCDQGTNFDSYVML